jgi:hypothetical protein
MTQENNSVIDIAGYKGLYSVANDGRVWSSTSNKWLKPVMRNGYCYVTLVKNKVKKQYAIHRLVAEAFHKNPEDKPQVNHIDGNKSNNCVDNLEWVTASENKQHAWATGLCKQSDTQRDAVRQSNLKRRRFTVNEVSYMRRMYNDFNFTQKAIAKFFKTSPQLVQHIVNYKCYLEVA